MFMRFEESCLRKISRNLTTDLRPTQCATGSCLQYMEDCTQSLMLTDCIYLEKIEKEV